EPAPEVSRDDLQLVLRRTAPDPLLLVTGVVRDPAGVPVADARVVLGRRGTRSDAEGRFRLERDAAQPDEPLLALARGYLPGRAVVPPATAPGEPVVVDVRLGGEPLALDGTLLDESGEPVAGARLWIDGGELVGGLDGRLATVEGWLGGGETLLELRARLGAAASGQSSDALRFDHPTEYWGWVLTDARGHFRIEGLLPRDYGIEVLMTDRLRRESFGPFPAGTSGLRLVLPGPGAIEVAGRIVGLDGTPVAGVDVQLHAWVLSVGDGTGDAHTGTRDAVDGPVRSTDESGRFAFEPVSVPERDLWLVVSSDAIMSDVVGMEDGLSRHGPLHDLTIPVVRRMHVRVELPVPAMADAFAVLDGRAERLALVSFEGEGRRSSVTGLLVDGRSPVYAVEETARTLVLLREGEEVWWRPIELTGEGVNVLGP
ncbi:MAG TPA: carboxypeptidase regulatory-like domain-containing protein, partial [Planctomycetota bacterium]|nr:carboxypeptidase regulatory-like domain-containing protein [Planctomycetota bacterium]